MLNFRLPRLYPIVNLKKDIDSINFIKRLLLSDVKILQLRSKELSTKELESVCIKVLVCREKYNANCKIIINDYEDICFKYNLDGIHLGQNDLSPITARKLLGPDKIIGLSTHNLYELQNAPYDTIDYLAIGPILKTKTKKNSAKIVGIQELKNILLWTRENINVPLVCIGGINKSNYQEIISAGVQSVAMISELEMNENLEEFIEEINLI